MHHQIYNLDPYQINLRLIATYVNWLCFSFYPYHLLLHSISFLIPPIISLLVLVIL
jgi:hypothetical protein